MMFLSIPPSHDLRVAAIGLSRKQKKVNYFSFKKTVKCSLHGWHQFVSSAWLWEGTRTLNIAEKNSAILGVLGPN